MAPPEPQASKFLGVGEAALHGTAHCGLVQPPAILKPGRIDLIWDPAPSRRGGVLGDRLRRRGSADTVDIVPPEDT